MQAKKIFIPRAAGFCRDCGLNQWNQATDRNGTEQYGGAGSYELLQYKIIKLELWLATSRRLRSFLR